MSTGVRPERLTLVVRECQVLIGDALPSSDRPLRVVLATFAERLPVATSPVERLLLRGLLMDVSFKWADAHHRSFHSTESDYVCRRRCAFNPSEVTARVWTAGGGELQV